MAEKLGQADLKLFSALLLNSRQPLSRLAAKARISKQNAAYRIARMVGKGYINSFIALIDATKIGHRAHYFYYKLRPLSDYQEKKVVKEILSLGAIALFRCEGEWNLIVGLGTQNLDELGKKSLQLNYILRGLVLQTTFAINLRTINLIQPLFVTTNLGMGGIIVLGEKYRTETVDERDRALLSAISGNARASYAELAKKTIMPPETVRYRLKSLEKRGIIMGYSISMGTEIPDMHPYRVFVNFSLPTEANIKKVENYLLNIPQMRRIVRQVCDYELMYDIRVKGAAEARKITSDLGKKFHRVIKTQVPLRILDDYHFSHFPNEKAAGK